MAPEKTVPVDNLGVEELRRCKIPPLDGAQIDNADMASQKTPVGELGDDLELREGCHKGDKKLLRDLKRSSTEEIRELPSSIQDLKSASTEETRRYVYDCYSSFIRRSREISLSDAEPKLKNYYSTRETSDLGKGIKEFPLLLLVLLAEWRINKSMSGLSSYDLRVLLIKDAGFNAYWQTFVEEHITWQLRNWDRFSQLKIWKRRFSKHVNQLNLVLCRRLAVELVAAKEGDCCPNVDSPTVVQELCAKLASLASLANEIFVGQKRYATQLSKVLVAEAFRLLVRKRFFWMIYLRLDAFGLKQLRLDMKFVLCFAKKGGYLSKTLLRLLSLKRKVVLSPKRSWRNITLAVLHGRSFKKNVALAQNRQLNFDVGDVPEDVWSRILMKLPLPSLIRSMSVSKGWNDMIRNPYLVKMNAGKGDHNQSIYFRRFGPIRDDIILYRDDLDQRHRRGKRLHVKPFNLFFIYLRHRRRGMIELRRVGPGFKSMGLLEGNVCVHGSGNGFICLANLGRELSVFLFNPVIWECCKLPQLCGFHEDPIIGFAFLADTGKYKVIVASDKAEMYEVGTDFWRQLPCALLGLGLGMDRHDYNMGAVGVFVDNQYHWGAFHKSKREHHYIMSFSFETETFLRTEFPVECELLDQPPLAVLNGSLAFVTQRTQGEFDVWVRNGNSWSRKHTVGSFPPAQVYTPMGIWDNRQLVVQTNVESIIICPLHLGGKGARTFKWVGDRQTAIMYHETLVSLKTVPSENLAQPQPRD